MIRRSIDLISKVIVSKRWLGRTLIAAILAGTATAVVSPPLIVVAAFLAVALVITLFVRVETGLYLFLLLLPFKNLEREIVGGNIGLSPLDFVLWPYLLVYTARLIFGSSLRKSRAYLFATAWFIAVLLSGLAASRVLPWAVYVVSRLINLATLIFTYNELSKRPRILKRTTALYILTALVVVLFGSLQLIGIIPHQIHDPFSGRLIGSSEKLRMGSFLGNANFLAAYLLAPLFLSLGVVQAGNRGAFRTIHLTYAVILVVVIVSTFSRAGFLAVSTGTGIFLFLGARHGNRRKLLRRLVIGMVSMILLTTAFFAVYNQVMRGTTRSGAVEAVLRGDVVQADRSTRSKLMLARMALGMFRSSPFVGVGGAHFQIEFPNYEPEQFPYITTLNAHNTYLQIMAETGIVGLLSFTLLFGSICLRAIRIALSPGHPRAGMLNGSIAALVSLCVFGAAHQIIRSEVWFVAGLVLAYTRIQRSAQVTKAVRVSGTSTQNGYA